MNTFDELKAPKIVKYTISMTAEEAAVMDRIAKFLDYRTRKALIMGMTEQLKNVCEKNGMRG